MVFLLWLVVNFSGHLAVYGSGGLVVGFAARGLVALACFPLAMSTF